MTSPENAPHKDRSVGLVLFGSLEVLIGLFCALMIPLSLLAVAANANLGGAGGSTDLKSAVSSIVIYGCAAVAFVWIGVGSIRARRWAHKLTLVLSWLWLITGVVTLVMCLWMIPILFRQMGLDNAMPGGGVAAVIAVVLVILGVVFVVMPTAFVLFYRSPNVAATCRIRDPGPSRIADAPSHILSLVLIYVLGAVSVLTMPAYNFVMPVFGMVLSGVAGALAWVVVLGILGYLVRATLDRDPRAWWTAVVATVVATLASTVAVVVTPIDTILGRMALPDDQLAIFQAMGFPGPAGLALLSAVAWGSFLAYLWYAKRFFKAS